MRGFARKTPRRLVPGQVVEVRPWHEIARTLNEHGFLDGLPFMPEMLCFCGRCFKVRTRLERTCEEVERSMRRIRDVVFLEGVRCDGSGHGGCARSCMIFWKDAWLKQLPDPGPDDTPALAGDPPDFPYPSRLSDGSYLCQSTHLLDATTPLPPFDPRTYWRDLRAKNYSLPGLGRLVVHAAYLRLRELLAGEPHTVLRGTCKKTPVEILDLQPGEWVQVKSREEVVPTLDRNGRNQGLAFTTEMAPFCGETFRVLRRLDKMIEDRSGHLIQLKNTVLLEGATCDGCSHLRGGCPRENFHFWREVWLRRVRNGRGAVAKW